MFLEGRLYYIDIAFPHVKLAIEIDGRRHEEDQDLFESDRWRQNALVADGWRVLRFTWEMLQRAPRGCRRRDSSGNCSQKLTLVLPRGLDTPPGSELASENEGISRAARRNWPTPRGPSRARPTAQAL